MMKILRKIFLVILILMAILIPKAKAVQEKTNNETENTRNKL